MGEELLGGELGGGGDVLVLGLGVALGVALVAGGGVMVAGGVLGGGTYAGTDAGDAVPGLAAAGEDEAGVAAGVSVCTGASCRTD